MAAPKGHPRYGGRQKGDHTPWRKTLAKRLGRERALKKLEITAEQVMTEIGLCAFVNRALMFDAQGNLLPMPQWPAEAQVLLESFEVIKKNAEGGDGHTDIVYRVRTASKIDALRALMKHFEPERHDVTLRQSWEDLVAGSRGEE